VTAPGLDTPTSGGIVDGRHVLPLRIYYEDTDAQGIVYYANWLRFLERGRTEMLRLLGQEHSVLSAGRGLNWVVRRCTIDYRKPARLDETIEVVTGCGILRGASFDMLQEARRGGETIVSADLLIACMDRDGRPARIPHDVKAAFAGVAAPQPPRSRHIRI
jgi:acyl-CoA thioester hydrolase